MLQLRKFHGMFLIKNGTGTLTGSGVEYSKRISLYRKEGKKRSL
jgi:hypothetical protein